MRALPSRRGRLLAASAGVVVVLVIAGGWWVASLNARAHEAEQHLLAARDALGSGAAASVFTAHATPSAPQAAAPRVSQLSAACAEALQADAELKEVGGQLQTVMPLLDALDSAPAVGGQVRAKTATFESGSQLAAAGAAICDGVQPLADLLAAPGDSTGDASTAIQAVLHAGPKLSAAADRLDATLSSLDNVHDSDLEPNARAGVASLRAKLPSMVQSLRDAAALLNTFGGQKRFLLVSQNPDELRATGGYIGSAGVLRIDDGSVHLVEYGSSRQYDTPADLRAPTPELFAPYLSNYWDLAGANWWASFPDVARQLEYFYSVARPDQPALDGVVAMDQSALQGLMAVLGPVDVPEYGERVSADDLQTTLDRYVHSGDPTDESGRKQFTAALSAAVLQQMLSAPRSQLPDLVRAMRTSLGGQHLLVAVNDATTASVLARHRWDGSLLPAAKDGLLVSDTELSASKQSQEVTRDVAYAVDLAATPPSARVTVTYTNHSQPRADVQYIRDYRTFLRVYAPGGATLTGASGFSSDPSSSQECGRSVFGGQVIITEGVTQNVTFTYTLPPSVVADGAYDLLVQAQPAGPPGKFVATVHEPLGDTSLGRDNAAGQSFDWRLPIAAGSQFQEQTLPLATGAGCDMPLVKAEPAAAPEWLEIPDAKISAQVVDIGLDSSGGMEPPPTPDVVGWYRMSARAGEPGNTVLSGHVDWGQNTAVFWGLRNLQTSDVIVLRGTDGLEHQYRVEWNRVFANDDPSALTVLQGSQDSLLTLITCDGVYDRTKRDYSGRRIVQAILTN
jgi:LPXTG-site transpeptidase (sortase) family protein